MFFFRLNKSSMAHATFFFFLLMKRLWKGVFHKELTSDRLAAASPSLTGDNGLRASSLHYSIFIDCMHRAIFGSKTFCSGGCSMVFCIRSISTVPKPNNERCLRSRIKIMDWRLGCINSITSTLAFDDLPARRNSVFRIRMDESPMLGRLIVLVPELRNEWTDFEVAR